MGLQAWKRNLMNCKKKQIASLLVLLSVLGMAGCNVPANPHGFTIGPGMTYRDVPGVTGKEIAAIEKIKSERQSLSYGMIPSTEAFVSANGHFAGFSTLFCEQLSALFGIHFEEKHCSWNVLRNGINDKEIDFTGEMIPTPERRRHLIMSYPIAERSLGVFTYRDKGKIRTATDLNGLKIGFYEETVTAQSIWRVYPTLRFEEVYISDVPDVPWLLETGVIDAFIVDAVETYTFTGYPITVQKDVLPLVYTPVSFSTGNAALEPFISVVNKLIEAGWMEELNELYNEGSHDYLRYELIRSLTDAERSYLRELARTGKKIPVAYENDNYPMSFYNEVEHKFQGIAPDILEEIRKLSGIMFYEATDKNTMWPVILEKLKAGEISIVTELLYSDKRKDDFLWSDPYATSNYALLSKTDFPFLKLYQVARATVGVGISSGYEDLYNQLFPDSGNVKYYDTQVHAMEALESSEIELLMSSTNVLLTMMNYLEKTGYKINILFDAPIEESRFGFGKNEEILCSIINKAQALVDIAIIEQHWKNRSFDYSRKIANERLTYLSASASVLLLLLVILIFLFFKNRITGQKYKDQMITLSTMYRSLPDLVYCMDTSGLYTSCNHSFEEFAGVPEADIIGRATNEVYPSDIIMAYKMMAIDKKVISENKIIKTEEWLRYPNMVKKLFEIVKVPMVNEGKVTGLLGINRDITQYREAERAAQEASRSKSNFLAKMSHEIRTPMNAIIGMAELALRENDVDDAHKHIVTVKQAGAHLLSIINDILDFSKIEMGKLEIIPGDYSFSSLLNDVISIIRMRVIDSQVRFAVNIDSKIPDALVGDETRIRQILLNVLNNAVKYTEKGFVTFTVCGELADDDTIMLVMEVMDSGKGIKKEDLSHLFGEYVQIDQEKNKGIEGVGLGLAITWNIVNAMEGDIKVYSEYGVGSTFTVKLPQKVRSHEILATVEHPEKENVLIYERREMYANSITNTVDNLGVRHMLVSNDNELREELEGSVYTYIFISFKLYEANKVTITRLGGKAKIVVLSEFGEAIPDKKLSILAMPVYSTTIANILNGVTGRFNYHDNNEDIIRFIAPSAKILIVDDINTNLKVAEGLMLPYKMQIDLCNSGKEALVAVQEEKYDLIFMDHKMPEMDGVETTLHIRELGNKDMYYLNVPIVILTANAVSGAKEMFLNNGFNDFLSKPIDTYQLKLILEKWIPKEKQKIAQNDEPEKKAAPAEKPGDGIEIRGVNAERGIFLSGGKIEMYLETLAIFNKDGVKKIEEIKSCLEKKDLKLFTIHIHAMKSATANIGADGLSGDARDLEEAGERGDLGYIEAHYAHFAKNLKLLLESISSVLAQKNDKGNKDSAGFDAGTIKEPLVTLRAALDALDAGIINDTIEDLKQKQLPDNLSAVISDIYEKILVCEYEEAASLIDTLLQNEN